MDANDKLLQALKATGTEKPREVLLPIAYHEAGHAVMCDKTGLDFDMFSIEKFSLKPYQCDFAYCLYESA